MAVGRERAHAKFVGQGEGLGNPSRSGQRIAQSPIEPGTCQLDIPDPAEFQTPVK